VIVHEDGVCLSSPLAESGRERLVVGVYEGSFLLLGKISWGYSLLAKTATGDLEMEIRL
jgi:hypothetical protein